MKNIFDWLKAINTTKPPVELFTDKDWEVWNSYMIHRFLSMDRSHIELINEIQEILPQDKKKIYSIYKEFIPKNNRWNKYIKSTLKKRNKQLVEHLSTYWECSQTEVRDYLKLLDNNEVIRILTSIGLNKKEIKPLLK